MSTKPRNSSASVSALVWSAILLVGLRILVAATLPLLSVEAYYWNWGQRVDLGYFDHPPMVAWLATIWPRNHRAEVIVRMTPLLLGFALPWILAWLAWLLSRNRSVAVAAAMTGFLLPVLNANGVLLQPDNGLILFTTLTWVFFWKAQSRTEGLVHWAVAGICAGLALQSKFHAWIMLPPLWVYLFVEKRSQYKRPGPWLTASIALLIVSPNLWWNAQNEWINYRFQWRRSAIPRAEFNIVDLLQYVLLPMITLSPFVYCGILKSVTRALRIGKSLTPELRYLLWAGLPLPLFLAVLSPFVAISPHWPAAGFPALVIFYLLVKENQGQLRRTMWFTSLSCGCVLGVVGALLMVTRLPQTSSLISRVPILRNVETQRTDWKRLGDIVKTRLNTLRAQSGQRLLMAPNWHLASLLGFYSGKPELTYVYEEADAHQYALWQDGIRSIIRSTNSDRDTSRSLAGSSALVVIKKGDPHKKHSAPIKKYDKYLRELEPLFARVEPQPSVLTEIDGTMLEYYGVQTSDAIVSEYLIFNCYGYSGLRRQSEEESR